MEGSPGAPLPRTTTLAVWTDVMLQGVARGVWSLRQAKEELISALLALAILGPEDQAALPPLARAGVGTVLLSKVRQAADAAGVTPRAATTATRQLGRPGTWAPRIGDG
eukprot:3902676-Alexandrium_andersonii.AAC.1